MGGVDELGGVDEMSTKCRRNTIHPSEGPVKAPSGPQWPRAEGPELKAHRRPRADEGPVKAQ